jgi:RNA ligase
MAEFMPFPSIGQFRNVLTELPYVFGSDCPESLTYRGTVKLHGTNAALIRHFTADGPYSDVIQSRNRILTIENDNQGCAAFLKSKNVDVTFDAITETYSQEIKHHIAIYGEYCGQGIQSKVALNKLKKRLFVIFAIKIDHIWVDMSDYKHVYDIHSDILNIMNFPLYEITISLTNIEDAQKQMSQWTEDIDKECPFVKQLAGISGAGEGIVWTCKQNPSSRLWFKTKGKTHCTKELIPSKTESYAAIHEFIDGVLTESRLTQGVQYLQEMNHPVDLQSIKCFITWVTDDVIKEETDTINDNGFKMTDVRKEISKKACHWFKTNAVNPYK